MTDEERNAVLEEAAKLCDGAEIDACNCDDSDGASVASYLAMAIRDLKKGATA